MLGLSGQRGPALHLPEVNLSLIGDMSFFDRSYRYNRPPEDPPFWGGVEPSRSTYGFEMHMNRFFNRLLQCGKRFGPALSHG